MKKVVMLINDSTYAFNLRGALIKRLVNNNFRVIIICQVLKYKEELEKMGAQIIDIKMDRHGTNPLDDLKLFKQYLLLLKCEKPDIVLTYNIKPNSYGGMACRILKIPYIPNITGLGTPIENPGKIQKLAIKLYKMGVSGAKCIMFQNIDNMDFFMEHKMIGKCSTSKIIPGSGVDLTIHPYMEWQEGPIHFLFAARIMKEKGIDLFLKAARKYASKDVIFDVCGFCDDSEYKNILENDPSIVYHGEQKDLNSFYAQSSCFLYPSYYPEGMSNVLLEAAASGRPIVAADRAGCRETLVDGITGFLVKVNDEESVLEATSKILKMDIEERKNMGLAGRMKMEKEFDREIVVDAYMEEINKII